MRSIVLALLAFAGVSVAGFIAVSEEPQDVVAQPQQAEPERPRARIATGSSTPERADAVADEDEHRLVRLTGIVVDEDGEIPQDAQVFIASEDERYRDVGFPVDAVTGAFEAMLPPGECPLIVEASGYVPLRLDGIVIAPGEELRDLRLTLQRGLSITGAIFNGDEASWDALVVLDGNGVETSTYAEAGTFVFDGLAPGTYRVRALSHDGGSAEVMVAAGEEVDLHLSTREVCGFMEHDRGGAMADTVVHVRLRLEGNEMGEWSCGADGCNGVEVEKGAFCMQVPVHAEVAVSAWLVDDDGVSERFAFDRMRAGERRGLRLRAEPLLSVRARLVDLDGQGIEETVEIRMPGNIAVDDEVVATDEVGALELSIPRQPEIELVIPKGTRLVAIDRLPLNAKIVERVDEIAQHHYLEPSIVY